MRKFLLITALLSAFAAMADAPNGYYAGISGLTDSALKTKLYNIIKDHSTNDYGGLFRESFIYTDQRADGSWWDMYSNTVRYVDRGWSGMNREHSFPKSWWGGDTDVPPYTDLNHLYPSDGDANMAKSNYPLGEVSPTGISFENGVVLVGTPVSGQGGGAKYVFEPADEYKGDFARTYFYMVTCYQDYTWKYSYIPRTGTYPSMQGWAIDLLLKWHRDDPVSDKEKARNDAVYKLQSNRNPYIDYPNLVEYIWGSMKGQPYEDSDLPPAGEGTLISPENGSTINFGDIVYGEDASVFVPIKGQLSANLSLSIYGDNASDFSIPVKSIDWNTVNTTGYSLKVTFTPSATGERKAKLLLYDGGLTGITSYMINLEGTAHDMPTFDTPVATEATNISSQGFRANWQTPANPDIIDNYVVNITEYLNGAATKRSVTTDGAETFLDWQEATSGATYSYTVQSQRFGQLSAESNVINVNINGAVAQLADTRPLTVIPIGNGIVVRCADIHTGLRVIDMTGRTVTSIDEATGDQYLLLPFGAYLVSSNECPRPVKVLVRE